MRQLGQERGTPVGSGVFEVEPTQPRNAWSPWADAVWSTLQRIHVQRLCASLVEHGRLPDRWDPSPEAVDAFAAEYERRQALELRPLSRRERAEARLTRYRERAGRARDVLLARLAHA